MDSLHYLKDMLQNDSKFATLAMCNAIDCVKKNARVTSEVDGRARGKERERGGRLMGNWSPQKLFFF